jgi:hypothetical protein
MDRTAIIANIPFAISIIHQTNDFYKELKINEIPYDNKPGP